MPIRPSTAVDITRLIDELSSPDPLCRETAVARLAIAGSPAVSKLIAVADDARASTAARTGALRALEASGTKRAAPLALRLAAGADDDLAAAAIAILGRVAESAGDIATESFDRLAALATDRDAPTRRRLAALDELAELPAGLSALLYETLGADPNDEIRTRVTRAASGISGSLTELIAQGLPDDPAAVAAVVREDAAEVGVNALRQVLEAVRGYEARAASADARMQWMATRGLVHQQLASRRSRLGVYDLREALTDARAPLPVGFLAAAAAIGDTSCLEPLAAAWVAAGASSADTPTRWWREHLAEAFHAIVSREGVTRRNPVLTRILERHSGAGVLVAAAKKT